MTKYTATYAHNDGDTPGTIVLDATTDTEAVAEIREFVEQGQRNGTWASVALSSGGYVARNQHGKAVGHHTD